MLRLGFNDLFHQPVHQEPWHQSMDKNPAIGIKLS